MWWRIALTAHIFLAVIQRTAAGEFYDNKNVTLLSQYIIYLTLQLTILCWTYSLLLILFL